nr:glucose repression regulatory protein TUP1 [Cryptococcus depauperatus CBS 7855]
MQPPGIYNHHRLPPAGTPSQSSMLPASSNSRLNELFDAIKQEYETVGTDGNVWKQQRDEYEAKVQSQINELGMIRQSLYELEANHAKIRQEYEGEISRLRRELEARGGPAASSSSMAAGPAPVLNNQPSPSTELPRPGEERAYGASAGGGLPGGLLNGGDLGRSRSPYPPPIPRPSSTTSRRAPPSSTPGPNSALASGTLNSLHPNSPPVHLTDLDPENVSRELKKEGADWQAMWSSQMRKQLDVTLVHSLEHETVVCCVKFSNDGKYLATGCNRTAQIYEVKSGGRVTTLQDDTTNRTGDLYIRSICFSPDGRYLATGAEDRQIRASLIWDIKQKRIWHLLQGHMQEIYSLDFSRDGRFLVSGSGDKSARIWDIEKGICVFNLQIEDFIHNEHGPIDAGITSVALSPDGKLVAAGSLDTMVRVWNVQTGQQVERLKGHKDSVYRHVSPLIESSTLTNVQTLRIWDLNATKREVEGLPPGQEAQKNLGVCQSTLNGHKDYVLSVAISPDGQWVVSGSKDRSIQFWHISTGQAQLMLQGHKNSVISIDLARSGGYLASGSGDCMARIWKYDVIA